MPIPIYTNSPVASVINGLGGAWLNESTLTFRPFEGGSYGGTIEGVDAEIQPLIVQLSNYGYTVSYKKSKSPISTVTFSLAVNNITNGGQPVNPSADFADTWEVIRNSVQKELLESDHPLVSALS